MQILFQPFEPGLSTVEKVDQPNQPNQPETVDPYRTQPNCAISGTGTLPIKGHYKVKVPATYSCIRLLP